jgi:flagella basal body P-ring formation protein FlgA
VTLLLRILSIVSGLALAMAPGSAAAIVQADSFAPRNVTDAAENEEVAAGGKAGTTTSVSISAETVQAAAERFLADAYPEHSQRLRVEVTRVSGTAPAHANLKIKAGRFEGVPRGRTHVELEADGNGAWSDAGWALLFVSHFDSISVVLRDIMEGETIAASDAGAAWMDVTSFRGDPLPWAEFASTDELIARRPIRSGEAIRTGDVRPPHAAQTGDHVTLNYRRGPVQLRLTCKARESGAVGDVIRIYSDDTRSMYRARLTAPGKADWISTL